MTPGDEFGMIRQRYRDCFAAELSPGFSDYIHRPGTGGSTAALGYARAADAPLFLEAYLDAPVEDLASIALDRPVARRQIVEIGNLAAVNPLAMIALWGAAANDLAALGDVAVATLTAPLRAMFRRIGIPIAAIAPARGERLGSAASAWGRYYDQDPWICAGIIADGQAAINCFVERRAARQAA